MDKNTLAGIYITVIFHLTVIIILLLAGIEKGTRKEESFVLDFSKYEEIEKLQQEMERLQKEVEFKEEISRRLDDIIDDQSYDQIRNYATDGSQLKDDRNTDADKLYEDARRLAEDLKNGQKSAIEENAINESVEMPSDHKKGQDKPKQEYTGPSVLRYTLDGRKASHLKIPAYRCYGGGEVTVIITVNRQGQVTNAKVMDEVSSDDSCLRSFAIRAARLSRFSVSQTAPVNQTGEIVYKFIKQ